MGSCCEIERGKGRDEYYFIVLWENVIQQTFTRLFIREFLIHKNPEILVLPCHLYFRKRITRRQGHIYMKITNEIVCGKLHAQHFYTEVFMSWNAWFSIKWIKIKWNWTF